MDPEHGDALSDMTSGEGSRVPIRLGQNKNPPNQGYWDVKCP